jgi:hypothetical protein
VSDEDAREQREAEALARALDGAGDPGAPDDALEAAAFLRYTADGGELSDERGAAILDDVLAGLHEPDAEPESVPWWQAIAWPRWLWPAIGAVAAAAVLVVVVPRAPERTALPSPGLALLEAQGQAAAGEGGLRLAREMRGYREHVYGALGERYGGVR